MTGSQGLPLAAVFAGRSDAISETLLKAMPDISSCGAVRKIAQKPETEETLKKLIFPSQCRAESLSEYPEIFLFLGRLLNGKSGRKSKRLQPQGVGRDGRGT